MAPDQRPERPADGDERSILLGWLAFHRDALAAKCAGFIDDQLATRSAALHNGHADLLAERIDGRTGE